MSLDPLYIQLSSATGSFFRYYMLQFLPFVKFCVSLKVWLGLRSATALLVHVEHCCRSNWDIFQGEVSQLTTSPGDDLPLCGSMVLVRFEAPVYSLS